MKISYIDKNFKNIDKVISYNSKGEIIDIVYRGSNEEFLDLTSLNEYGWEFLVKKLGEADEDKLQHLEANLKETLYPDEIDSLRKVIFPTGSSNISGSIRYFGSVTIGSQQLVMIKISSNSNEVILFDDIFSTDPKIKLEFSEYETTKEKIFWFVISLGEIQNIDLSQFSWINSRNPHRNQKNYLMSESDIFNPIKVIQNIQGNEVRDTTNGNLLGNKKIENHISLDRKLEKSRSLSSSWDRRCIYKFGDTINYNERTWKSIVNNNKDNIPGLSNKWVVDISSSDDWYRSGTSRIQGDDINSIVSPTKFRLIGNNSIEFRIMFEPGEVFENYMLSYFNETEEYVDNPELFNYNLYKNVDLSKSKPYLRLNRHRHSIDTVRYIYADFAFKKISSIVKFPGENPEKVNIGDTIKKEIWRGNKGLPKRIIKSVYLNNSKETLMDEVIDNSPSLNTNGNIDISVYVDAPSYIEVTFEEPEDQLLDNEYIISLINYAGFYVNKSTAIFKQGEIVTFTLIPIDNKINSEVSMKIDGITLNAAENGSLSYSGDKIGKLNLERIENKYLLTISDLPNNNIELEIWR